MCCARHALPDGSPVPLLMSRLGGMPPEIPLWRGHPQFLERTATIQIGRNNIWAQDLL